MNADEVWLRIVAACVHRASEIGSEGVFELADKVLDEYLIRFPRKYD